MFTYNSDPLFPSMHVCTNMYRQLMKVYGEELLQMVRLISSAEITDFRVNKYLEEIKAIAALYIKVCSIILHIVLSQQTLALWHAHNAKSAKVKGHGLVKGSYLEMHSRLL